MECLSCGSLHDGTYGSGKFCSRSCSNRRQKPEELRKKLSEKMTGRSCGPSPFKGKTKTARISKTCQECGSNFFATKKDTKKYCSMECSARHRGGYREGSGRSHSGYYKGIFCGSTYELVWVIFQLDHGLKFERFTGFVEYNNKKYYPDFLQNGKIIEIKGFEKEDSVEIKNEIARKNGYDIVVLRKHDLETEFEWVKKNYTSDFKSLYDGYKPKYQYVCGNCSKIFSKNKKLKTDKGYCSRQCSLLGNRKVSGKNQYTKRRDAAGVATSPSN